MCMGEVPLCDIESRVQGAGGVQGGLVMLRVYVELLESMTVPSPRCTPNIATRGGK